MFGPIFYNLVTLLVILNPIEAAAIFATLAGDRSPAEQLRIARQAAIVALGILLVFGFTGEALLRAIGVGFPAFRIAGGLLLLKVAFDMVFAKAPTKRKINDADQSEAAQADDPSVFPLAIPMIVGPGALTSIVTLMAATHQQPLQVVGVVGVAVLAMALVWAAMRAARSVYRVLGSAGVNGVSRVTGILLAAIAIQLAIEGAKALAAPDLIR